MGAVLKSKSGRTILRNLKTRMKRLRDKVDGTEVVAGFVRDKSSPESILKAYRNEFGSTTNGAISTDLGKSIPSRPFMYQSLREMKGQISAVFADATTRNLDGKMATAGDVMAISIESSLLSGDFVPNTAYTLARKQGTQPLVDTGEMVRNITSEVRRAK